MDVSNLAGKWLKNIKGSAVSDHLLQCNCNICSANQLIGFYMMATLAFNELIVVIFLL